MSKRNYKDYLLSDKWQARKEKYYSTHPKKCYVCGTKFRIVLHHCTYKRIGRERDCDLISLCGEHHKEVHVYAKSGKKFAKRLWRAHKEVKGFYKKTGKQSHLESLFNS